MGPWSVHFPPFPTATTLILDPNVNEFVVKAPHAGDCKTFGRRQGVPPDQILVFLAVDHEVVIIGDALVRTLGHALAVTKVGRPQRRVGEVVAWWKTRLVEMDRGRGLGEDVVAQRNTDGTGGGESVDAFEGVFWVDVDGNVFLEPLVWCDPTRRAC